MTEKNRKNFSSQFKAKVAIESIRGIKSVNEIAQEFGVHPTQVGHWKKILQEQASCIFDTVRGPKPVDPSASQERRYSEIGRLKMELDWLKKKPGSAYNRQETLDRHPKPVGADQTMRTGGCHAIHGLWAAPGCRTG